MRTPGANLRDGGDNQQDYHFTQRDGVCSGLDLLLLPGQDTVPPPWGAACVFVCVSVCVGGGSHYQTREKEEKSSDVVCYLDDRDIDLRLKAK